MLLPASSDASTIRFHVCSLARNRVAINWTCVLIAFILLCVQRQQWHREAERQCCSTFDPSPCISIALDKRWGDLNAQAARSYVGGINADPSRYISLQMPGTSFSCTEWNKAMMHVTVSRQYRTGDSIHASQYMLAPPCRESGFLPKHDAHYLMDLTGS